MDTEPSGHDPYGVVSLGNFRFAIGWNGDELVIIHFFFCSGAIGCSGIVHCQQLDFFLFPAADAASLVSGDPD